jgi:hypothetical protein
MSGAEIRALAAGHVTLDRFGDAVLVGGSAFFAARAWQALGADAALATAWGPDFGREAGLAGLRVFARRASQTTIFSNLYPPGAPRRQLVETRAPKVSAALVPAPWRRPDVAFLAPVMGEIDPREWFAALEAPVVGVGLQGFLKRAGPRRRNGSRPVVRLPSEPDLASLTSARAVFLSDEDVALFSDPSLVDRLRRLVPLVVLTRGADGATVYEGRGSLDVGALPVPVVDPTGAGDTFAAAFLLALARGEDARDAARLATAAAAIVVQGLGGTTLERVGEADLLRDRVSISPSRFHSPAHS